MMPAQLPAASLLGLLALLGNVALGRADTARGIPSAVTTLAGTGDAGLAGDGDAPGRARLSRPAGLAVDAAGNLYVADAGNNRIRRILRRGAITTVAGGGPTGYLQGGFAGDGGPATEAELNAPSAVAVGPTGDLFVADARNNRVRLISADGTITTLAGNGTEGFRGDGGPATEAELDFPAGLAVDRAGNLYIADTNNHRVRKVTPDRTITTVAGSGPTGYLQGGLAGDGRPATAARLARPFGLAVDSAGGLYIADGFNNRVRRVTPDGTITTVAGSGPTGYLQGGLAGDGGPATAARLNAPRAVALDAAGNLYVADALNHRIRRVGPDGIIHTIAGSGPTGYLRGSFAGDGGPPSGARLAFPAGLALDLGGILYIADEENHRIRAITPGPAGQ
jgi:sugar lactone lactonase YvrE